MRNHLWYLTGQMVPLGLCDTSLGDDEREELAKAILSHPRQNIELGRPKVPDMMWPGVRPSLAYFVTANSWLVFDLLQLTGEFLSVPCSYWPNFGEYKKLEEFCLNLPSVNDSAERGCHLITEFMNQVHSDEARQDLIQCVQYWRKLIKPDFYKKSLKNI